MTRYFFQLVTARKSFTDDLGEEFESLAEAQAHARAVACELARNHAKDDLAGRAVVLLSTSGDELLRVALEAQPDGEADGELSRASGIALH